MPSLDQLDEYREAIHNQHPVPHNVWGTMDGLKCSIEQAPDGVIQSRYYNGWKSGHFVTAVICFVPDGTIPAIFSTFQDAATTVNWQIGGNLMKSWRPCMLIPV